MTKVIQKNALESLPKVVRDELREGGVDTIGQYNALATTLFTKKTFEDPVARPVISAALALVHKHGILAEALLGGVIYVVAFNGNYTIMPGIKFHRIIAMKSGQLRDVSITTGGDPVDIVIKSARNSSSSARVHKGLPSRIYAKIIREMPDGQILSRTEEYMTTELCDQGSSDHWRSSPLGMAKKRAEADSLRKTFPDLPHEPEQGLKVTEVIDSKGEADYVYEAADNMPEPPAIPSAVQDADFMLAQVESKDFYTRVSKPMPSPKAPIKEIVINSIRKKLSGHKAETKHADAMVEEVDQIKAKPKPKAEAEATAPDLDF